MQAWVIVLISLAAVALGIGGGIFLDRFVVSKSLAKNKTNAVKIIEDAYAEAKTVKKEAILEAKEEAHKVKEEVEREVKDRRGELQKTEERIMQKEENLDKKELALDKKTEQFEETKKEIETAKDKALAVLAEQNKVKADLLKELEKVAGLKKDQAKNILVKEMTEDAQKEAAILVKRMEDEAKNEGDKKAKNIVALAIQKCATDLTQEMTVSVVPLPNDEMKGRIIGREGRNIRAIEAATGVDLIVDDTPEAITVSGFDPVRREIARQSIEKLIVDGRIHPTRIEEIVAKVTKDLDEVMKKAGENAAAECDIFNFHPEIIKVLGRLKYRTSYGQNVLKHSLETAFIAGLLAAELGADEKLCKRAGILHDIGKALDHETEGTHVTIGMDLAKKYKESDALIHCIEAHHGGVEFKSVEAIIIQVADAISSSRPGARRESLENYVKRLQKLEEIANSFKGVEKSFAIQAGREVRIVVKPEEITDEAALFLAKDIAKKIEGEMEYPGQIKVNVIREARFTEYAK